MDATKRCLLERHLADAERHVATGDRVLAKQAAMIENRRSEGLDVELAMQLFGEMENTQRLHVAERDRLRRELSAADSRP
jgi:hypothetical protein